MPASTPSYDARAGSGSPRAAAARSGGGSPRAAAARSGGNDPRLGGVTEHALPSDAPAPAGAPDRPSADTTVAREPVVRVSTLELFFDLVFVFTITQLTAVLARDLTIRGVMKVALMAGVIFWMYGGYAWLTNAVAPTNRFRRTVMLIGMGAFLAAALAMPTAFGPAGWVFGLAYVVINVAHSALFIIAGGPGAARAMSRLAWLNATSTGLVLLGGLLPPGWRYAFWALALAVQIASPYLHPIGGFTISPSHFVERHGLVVIVALGESVIAIGVGAAGLAVDLKLVTVAVLGLTLIYLMWWVYFGGDELRAEHALAAADPIRRARIAITAYGYAHYGLLLGIIAVAAGIKLAVGHATTGISAPAATALGAGLCLYVLSDVAFRSILGIGSQLFRVVAALITLATIPLGMAVAMGQLVALIVLLVVMLVVEEWYRQRSGARALVRDTP
jgi:low temperature requirement protein LtrA